MSFFFGSSKPKEVDAAAAIQQNRNAIAMHEKRNALLQTDVLRLTQEARASTDKGRKVMLMKRIKLLQAQQIQNENVILNLERQKLLLENAALNKEAVVSLQATSSGIHAMGINVVDVERVMDDLEEHHVTAQDVGSVLGNIGGTDEVDEDELLRELAALDDPSGGEKEVVAAPLSVLHPAAFPAVPTTVPVVARTRQSPPPANGGPPNPPPTLVDRPATRKKADTSKLKALFE